MRYGKKGKGLSLSNSDILREYRQNNYFRKAIDSGMFRYAEGQFVVDDSEYVKKINGAFRLTEYAKTHLNECTLCFEIVETVKLNFIFNEIRIKPKQALKENALSFQASYNTGFIALKRYVADAINLDAVEARVKASEEFRANALYHRKLLEVVSGQSSFFEAFNALLKAVFEPLGILQHKWSKTVFDATGISDKVFRDMRNGTKLPSHRTIVAFCAGFDFNISMAERMLMLCGKAFSQTDEHDAYRLLLTAYRGYNISERNDVLEAMGFGRLTDDK